MGCWVLLAARHAAGPAAGPGGRRLDQAPRHLRARLHRGRGAGRGGARPAGGQDRDEANIHSAGRILIWIFILTFR